VSNAADSKRLLVLALFFEGSLVVSALFLAWYVGLALREQWRVEATAWPEIGLWALPPVVCFFVLVHVPWAPLRRIEALLDEWFVPLLAELKWHEVGLLAALAGIGEELLFRGVLTPWAMDRLGVLWALVLPNVLFGLLHPVTPTYAVLAFVAGLYMSCAWYFTGGLQGGLVAPVIAHTVYDWVAMCYLTMRYRRRVAGNTPGACGDVPPVAEKRIGS